MALPAIPDSFRFSFASQGMIALAVLGRLETGAATSFLYLSES
jgi:hypothetical protein